jgi:acetyltransferase-like isoleucine patch superfamily enzyme
MTILRSVRALYNRVCKSIELRKYNPHTIAEYFRKQGAQIGEGCFIVPTDLGAEPYLIKIGNHVAVAAEVAFATHDGAVWVFRDQVPDLQLFGPIVIEDNCIIGLRSTIFPNVRIGRNSVVAAGSLVINDVPPNSIVMGVPARSFGSMDKYREKCLQRWAEQRPPDVTFAEGETWWDSPQAADKRLQLRKHLLGLFRDQLRPQEFEQADQGNRLTPAPDKKGSQAVHDSEVSTTS